MTIFKNDTHQEIWVEHHCERCWHYSEEDARACPILAYALRTGRKPPQWDRSTRKNATMADSIRCNMETKQPPRADARRVANEDVSMFDVEPPVNMDGDHA